MMKVCIRLALLASTAIVSLKQVILLETVQQEFDTHGERAAIKTNLRQSTTSTASSTIVNNNDKKEEYILWSKNETYFQECRSHFVGNQTWGEQRRLLADKIEAKKIVESLNIRGLFVPPTLAILGVDEVEAVTVDLLQALPQPYIVKASHTSGGVARVHHNKYDCFKRCRGDARGSPYDRKLKHKGIEFFQAQATYDLQQDFSNKHKEYQYSGLEPRIIIEKDIITGSNTVPQEQHEGEQEGEEQEQEQDAATALAVDTSPPPPPPPTDVTFWYVANGKPLFVSIQCGYSGKKGAGLGTLAPRVFVSTRYHRLNMYLARSGCDELPPKPANWDDQVRIATELATKALVPHREDVVRIDLYTIGQQQKVYFSEFTFTTNYCANHMGFHPRIADGLLYAVSHNQINPTTTITPKYIEQTINDQTSWSLVTLQKEFHLVRDQSESFPSPLDLCEQYALTNHNLKYKSQDFQNDPIVQSCLSTLKEVVSEPLRCIINTNDNNNSTQSGPQSQLKAIGVKKHPTFASVMARVDWGRAIILLFIVCIMTYTGVCTQHERNQFLNNILYLVGMTIVIYVTTDVDGLYSGTPITTIVYESYQAFVHVHPMESWLVALSHFGTYWFYVASWNSKSLRNLLFWQFMIEAVTATINEYTHHTEEQDDIRCMRIAFIGAIKNYAVDNIIRVYILPPFFVFGYMLPKFIQYWIFS